MLKCIDELGNDPDEKFLGNHENEDTVGYMSDLGTCPEVLHGEIKPRVYDEKRKFVGNYKTVLGKEGIYKKQWAKIRKKVLHRGLFRIRDYGKYA